MVAGERADGGSGGGGGNQVTSARVRKVILSIKEIVGNHSDADIYAALKESNMDPNDAAQKLLNQDPFHEVKRKRDKKKEPTGYRALPDTRRHVQNYVQQESMRHVQNYVQQETTRHVQNYVQQDTRRHVQNYVQPAKSRTWDQNVRRGGYVRNSVPAPGVSREFRIVRDNRVKQIANGEIKPESLQHSSSGKEQDKSDSLDKSSKVSDVPQSVLKPSNSVSDGPVHKEEVGQRSTSGRSAGGKALTNTNTSSQTQGAFKGSSRSDSMSAPPNSVIGVYSSSSDPVHVPSPASRPAGIVGAIRREVGVVGVRKQPANHSASSSSVPNGSISVQPSGKDASSSRQFVQTVMTPKSSQLNQQATSDPALTSVVTSRPSSANQYSNRTTLQTMGHQKAVQSAMEWKPKSSQKAVVNSPTVGEKVPVPNLSHSDNSSNSNTVDVTNLTEKISNVNIPEERHVIIPEHLRVPESERTQLTFGSFGSDFDSTMVSSSASHAFGCVEEPSNVPSISISSPVPMGSSENASGGGQGDLSDSQTQSRSDSPASASESEKAPPRSIEQLDHQGNENYSDIGLVQSRSTAYTSSHTHQLQAPASLPSFSEYDSQKSYEDLPFLRTVMEDSARAQAFASSSEAVSSHTTNSNPPSNVALPQQQQPLQQQPLPNVYPQVHISHFPNFMPYRHIFSPVYMPPMAVPNYSSNSAFPHPSNGSSYLLMPGGSSHITAGGMKYAASQYKQVPAGSPTTYGNYTNPTGFAISPPGSVGGPTGLDDAARIKYKDNNLYVPNPQAEASDIWIQTPREIPSLQSPYYSLAGQPPHAAAAAAAYVPAAHAGHASFNAAAAAQSSHMQYPGLYHSPASPAPIGAHHLVHQSGLGSNIGAVGVAPGAPGPQVGAYQQQPQLSHINWPGANF